MMASVVVALELRRHPNSYLQIAAQAPVLAWEERMDPLLQVHPSVGQLLRLNYLHL